MRCFGYKEFIGVGVYDSRGNYSPTPSPCLQPERKPASKPAPAYTWENPPPRLVVRPEPEVNCFIGVRFCWDNGEYLPSCDWALTQSNGEIIRGALDCKSFLSRWTVGQSCKVQLEPQFDPDRQVVALRNELQNLLNEIIEAEREQAAALEAVQDQRSGLDNVFHAQIAYGEGFLYGAWGHANTAYEFGQLANPYNALIDAVIAAWQAKVTPGKGWLEAFHEQFTANQHQELAEALNFDPSAINREQLARAYEVTNYIFEDEQSRSMLARFAGQYVKVQIANPSCTSPAPWRSRSCLPRFSFSSPAEQVSRLGAVPPRRSCRHCLKSWAGRWKGWEMVLKRPGYIAPERQLQLEAGRRRSSCPDQRPSGLQGYPSLRLPGS
jgi:hypothetical protein